MKLTDLCLNIVDPWYLERRVVPPYDTIYCACVQDVMRDYADLADWMNENYRDEPFADVEYAKRLQNELRARIVDVLVRGRI